MSYVSAALALGGAGLSIYQGQQQQKQAESLYGQQQGLLTQQLGIAKEQYARFQEKYLPLEKEIAREAAVGIPEETRAIQVGRDVRKSFDIAEDIRRRNMERMGIDPESEQFKGLDRDLDLARVLAESGARTRSRRGARLEEFNRRMQAMSLGAGRPYTAMQGLMSGAQAYGQMGDVAAGGAADYARLGMNIPGFIGALQQPAGFGGTPSTQTTAGIYGGANITSKPSSTFVSGNLF